MIGREINLTVVEGERDNLIFGNPIVKWKYMIKTGSRCPGITSNRTYKCPIRAEIAGERMIKKLIGD